MTIETKLNFLELPHKKTRFCNLEPGEVFRFLDKNCGAYNMIGIKVVGTKGLLKSERFSGWLCIDGKEPFGEVYIPLTDLEVERLEGVATFDIRSK